MDKLRAVVTGVADWVVHRRLVVALRASPAHDSRPHDDERGQGLPEYALILALIGIVAIASLIFLGETIAELFWDPIDEDFGRILCDVIGICPS